MMSKSAVLVLLSVILISACTSQDTKQEKMNELLTLTDPVYVAQTYLSENFDLSEYGIRNVSIKQEEVEKLTIKHNKFQLEYLIAELSFIPTESETFIICQNIAEQQNMTMEECIKSVANTFERYFELQLNSTKALCEQYKSLYNTTEECIAKASELISDLLKPIVLCPVKVEPQGITGAVGPGGWCISPEGEVSKENDKLLYNFGDGHRLHYAKYTLKIDPYSSEADNLVDKFVEELKEAKWSLDSVKVTEVIFPIEVRSLGCHPQKIIVYIDEFGTPITSSQYVICTD